MENNNNSSSLIIKEKPNFEPSGLLNTNKNIEG
jgi:hypothetical protein